MDPALWGPKLWNVIFDCCFVADGDPELRPSLIAMLGSLCYVIPCPMCRNSYRHHVLDLPFRGMVVDGRAVEWAWRLKDTVNESLGRPPGPSLECVRRRLSLWTSAASPWDLLDLAFIVLLSSHPEDENEEGRYVRHIALFFGRCVPDLLARRGRGLRHCSPFVAALRGKPLLEEDVRGRASLMRWLCSCADEAGVQVDPRSVASRYSVDG